MLCPVYFVMRNLPSLLSLSVRSFLNVEEEPDLGMEDKLFGRELGWAEEEWNDFLSEGAEDFSLSRDVEDVGGTDLAASSFMSQ